MGNAHPCCGSRIRGVEKRRGEMKGKRGGEEGRGGQRGGLGGTSGGSGESGPAEMGKKTVVQSLMVIDNGARYLSISDNNNRLEARVIQRGDAERLKRIHGRVPKVTYSREPNGQVSRNSRKFGLMPKQIAEELISLTFSTAQQDDFGVSHGWPSLEPYSNEMPTGRVVCCLMAKPEDILALCLFKHGFSETGIEERYHCDYMGIKRTEELEFGFGICALYKEEGVAWPVRKVELFSDLDETYWDSNHISHLWV